MSQNSVVTAVRYTLETRRKKVNTPDTMRVGVWVSGGVDSMVLLHAVNYLKETCDLEIKALHVLFNDLVDSEECLALVILACKEPDINLVTASNILNEESKEGYRKAIKRIGFASLSDIVLTGHILDDQIETILFKIFRGTGINGLVGIRKLSVIRKDYKALVTDKPLLSISKEDIYEYAREHDITFIKNTSNQDLKYDRNYIRNVVLPIIKDRFKVIDMLKVSSAAHELLKRQKEQTTNINVSSKTSEFLN